MSTLIRFFFLALLAYSFTACATNAPLSNPDLVPTTDRDTSPIQVVTRDSFIFIPIEITTTDTFYVDTTYCPPADTPTVVTNNRYLPGKTITRVVPVRDTALLADLAYLESRYEDLKLQYDDAIKQLESCRAKPTTKKPTQAGWQVWVILLGLMLVAATVVFSRRQ